MRLWSFMVSWAWLALLFWKQVFRCLLRRREGEGYGAFRRNYWREGLLPLSAAEAADGTKFANCIMCGLCDSMMFREKALSESRGGPPRHEYPSVSFMTAGLVRSMPEFRNGASYIGHLMASANIEAIGRFCPFNISVAGEAKFMKRYIEADAAEARKGGGR